MNLLQTCFKGRLNRTGFWISLSTVIILFSIFSSLMFGYGYSDHLLSGPKATVDTSKPMGIILAILMVVELVAAFLTNIAIIGKRCHDIGVRNFWFLFAIPYVGILGLLIVGLYPGQPDSNRYGSRPSGHTMMLTILSGIMPLITIVVLAICLSYGEKLQHPHP